MSPRAALITKYGEQTKSASPNSQLSLIEAEKNAKKWMSPVGQDRLKAGEASTDNSADVRCSLP